jgi:serine/threonine protein kinase
MTEADDNAGSPHENLDSRFAPGDRIGDRYRIVGLLGEGAIGEVYEAYDEALAEPLALKTLRAHVASHAVTVERFRREIQLARKVTHRNVCRTYDFGRHELADGTEVLFLTMELLRGVSMAKQMVAKQRYSTAEALPLVLQMTAGLEAAHQAGVIHRDFKPGNLVLVPEAADATPSGLPRLVITDFGIARRHGLGEYSITSTGEALGTPLYMAPEQVVSGTEPITPATDIYALGIVLFEMLTNEMPFTGNSTNIMALKRIKEKPMSPRAFAPDLDPLWDAVIMRCMERLPARRFQTAKEVADALTGERPVEPLADDAAATKSGKSGLWRTLFGRRKD